MARKKATVKGSEFIRNNNAIQAINEGLGFQAGYHTSNLVSGTCLLNFVRAYPMSNNWQLLSDLYFTEGVIQSIVDVPVNDAFSGGIEINSGVLDADEIQELQNYIQGKEVLNTLNTTAKWTRLYGGGAVVIVTDGEPADPLNIKKEITRDSTLEFYAADLWELNMVNNKTFAEEKPYLDEKDLETPFNWYGVPLNKTRAIKVYGKVAPSRKRPILRGWGMSIIDALIAPLTEFATYQHALLEFITEAKISTFYIPGMDQLTLSSDGLAQLTKIITEMNMLKNNKNALVLPVEAKFEQKELAFTWLDSALTAIQDYLCAACRMPHNKLFGDSAKGFASGQDALENYNKMVQGIRIEFEKPLKIMLELICQKLFGFIPNDLQIKWKSLRVMTEEQEEIIKNHQLQRILALHDRGIITSKEVLKQANLNNLTPTEVMEMPTEDFPLPPAHVSIRDTDSLK